MADLLSVAEIAEMMRQVTHVRVEKWLDKDVGTWRWWILAVLLIAPWFIWYLLVDKKRLPELTLFGTSVMVIIITLDEAGFVLSLWNYPIDVIPIFPRLTSIDYTVLPIIYMLLYQYFSNWKSFFWALLIASTLFAFVAEPLTVYFGFYQLLKWNYLYSFPIYIVLGLFCRWVVRMIFDIARKS